MGCLEPRACPAVPRREGGHPRPLSRPARSTDISVWPGQAISYKVGERVWLAARQDAEAREGAAFDLKAWHMRALALGSVGLDVLREELGRV